MMKKSNVENIFNYLNTLIPNPKCELEYHKDYELLIATVLSAQCTDKRVNEVTKVLFNKYTLKDLKEIDVKKIESIIRPVGSYTKKASYIKEIATHLINDYQGVVPNNREYLESLSGVGRKTCNVVLSNLFDVPCIAVDTHVERVSKRLGFASKKDSVYQVEQKLMKLLDSSIWSRTHHQLVLFGRYYCKAIHPECATCGLKEICKEYKYVKSRKSI